MMLSVSDSQLIEAASSVLKHSYSPYSKFRVGAAVRTETGEIFTACNVENASYGLTICAERAAIFKMVSEGCVKVDSIAIVAAGNKIVAPCGACRQVINEFAGDDCRVICSSGDITRIFSLKELLPESFGPSNLVE